MKCLRIFDEKNYDTAWPRVYREAVRAVIIREDKIALVRSETEGFYKFPGGGIEPGETHSEALIRETSEESGLHVLPESIKAIGFLHELRKGLYGNEIFEQKSYYYFAEVDGTVSKQRLDSYEAELGYVPEWTNIEAALEVNKRLWSKYETKLILRESYMLEYLLKK